MCWIPCFKFQIRVYLFRRGQNLIGYSQRFVDSIYSEKFKSELPNHIKSLEFVGFDKLLLRDENLPKIVDFIRQIPTCKVLDLSNNLFGSSDDKEKSGYRTMKKLISFKFIRFVIITTNPIGSIDCADFLGHITAKEAAKLIWIPQIWLTHGKWRQLVNPLVYLKHTEVLLYDIIEQTHKSFYCAYPTHSFPTPSQVE